MANGKDNKTHTSDDAKVAVKDEVVAEVPAPKAVTKVAEEGHLPNGVGGRYIALGGGRVKRVID